MPSCITMRCVCGHQSDHVFDGAPPQSHHTTCRGCGAECEHQRVWTSPNIGAVKGAGGSPARSAK